jgi:hypothetical protein
MGSDIGDILQDRWNVPYCCFLCLSYIHTRSAWPDTVERSTQIIVARDLHERLAGHKAPVDLGALAMLTRLTRSHGSIEKANGC